MEFAKNVWKLLVGIKDGMVLVAMLLFFMVLCAVLTARAPETHERSGALLIRLNGALVEEKSDADPVGALLSGGGVASETRERDVLRALRGAVDDNNVKAVVIDLSRFAGGGLVHLEEVGAAMDAVRAAHKPVLVYGFALEDGGTLLAAHASDAWIDPMGGAFLPGPGGYRLYYGALLDRLKITAHIFRVGTYKDYVEPYFRNGPSEPSRAASKALYDTIWANLKDNIARARPHAKIDQVTKDPAGWFKAAGGDGAKAALAAGLIDHIGTWAEFGAHVATIVGEDDSDEKPGSFAHTGLAAYLSAHPVSTSGKAIGVVTVAGEIVDGKAGPGTAGGERIAALIDRALANDDLSALVVRVDSPGGSVTGAEAIRLAILRAKAKGLPVVISMANVAASGGYWVATPGAKIFAQPGTVTGSIGIFAVIPSFEKLLASYGVTGDGYRTTPISGQPDPTTGLTPEVEAMLQAGIENGYARFVGLVAASRHKTAAQVDNIAQGRVWDGGTAHQLGLVDQFGGLDDAMEEAATAAHLKAGEWHEEELRTPPKRPLGKLLAALKGDNDDDAMGEEEATARDWVGLVTQRQRAGLARAVGDAARMLGGQNAGAKAYCLECSGLEPSSTANLAPAAITPAARTGFLAWISGALIR